LGKLESGFAERIDLEFTQPRIARLWLQELDFKADSVNYNWQKLWHEGQEPR
jgi:hypothetical protein